MGKSRAVEVVSDGDLDGDLAQGAWSVDSSASFQGSDTNSASSVLIRGTSGEAVALYNGTGTD
ncbi:hypothetical protein [Streptomyces sp. R08]|uniref:Uncharacterized protein n=1 Tax=Streptomyces sp. R08 TaxID=3238624 RepID=A0AB39M980_9ACTN